MERKSSEYRKKKNDVSDAEAASKEGLTEYQETKDSRARRRASERKNGEEASVLKEKEEELLKYEGEKALLSERIKKEKALFVAQMEVEKKLFDSRKEHPAKDEGLVEKESESDCEETYGSGWWEDSKSEASREGEAELRLPRSWERATSVRRPEWFCGSDVEWDFARMAAERAGWSVGRRITATIKGIAKLPGVPEQVRRNAKKAFGPLLITSSDAALVGALGGAAIGVLSGLVSGVAGSPAEGSLIGGFGLGVMSALSWGVNFSIVGLATGIVIGQAAKAVEVLGERRRGWTRELSEATADGIGPKRLREMAETSREAESRLGEFPETRKDALEARIIAATLGKEAQRAEKRNLDRLARNEEARRSRRSEVASKLKKDMGAASGTTNSTESLLEKRLRTLGEKGADGLAAAALWSALGDTDAETEAERRRVLTERLPRLIDAYERVPKEERSTPQEALGGETPEGSLRRGLAAALASALAARGRAAEKAAVGLEAEARVLESAAAEKTTNSLLKTR